MTYRTQLYDHLPEGERPNYTGPQHSRTRTMVPGVVRLSTGHPEFPECLLTIPDPSVGIFALGDTSLLRTRCIAIIGTREPSEYGYQTAYKLAHYYASAGYTIVAGLAPGIDTAAHLGALAAKGHTIAVLACTIDWNDINGCHRGNSELAKEIIAHDGLLITEYGEREYNKARYFERDRLQSALSHIVIPVQCGLKSGTLHTVSHAIAQGKHVWVPRPYKEDYLAHKEKYAGVMQVVQSGHAQYFSPGELDHIL